MISNLLKERREKQYQCDVFGCMNGISSKIQAWTAVSFNHVVLTQESHLCVNHRPATQKLVLKMCRGSVCFYVCVCGTHQPAAMCSFQVSQIADNRLSKHTGRGRVEVSSAPQLTICTSVRYMIVFFCHYLPVGGQSTPKRLTKTPPTSSVHTCSKILITNTS